MDRQTLRDWVHRYDEQGLAGLADLRTPCAPPRKLTVEQEAAVAEWVRQGPTLEQHKVVRWRLVDLRDEIARTFGVQVHERTVGKLMARLNFSRVSVRPQSPAQDEAAQEAHKKLCRPGRRRHPRTRARQADRSAPRDQRYQWASLFGAVCPARRVGAALVLPFVNTEAMNLHLAEISTQVTPGAHAVLPLDGAGWHQSGTKLKLPDNIGLLPLPPYSPELNPVGNCPGSWRAPVWRFAIWMGRRGGLRSR